MVQCCVCNKSISTSRWLVECCSDRDSICNSCGRSEEPEETKRCKMAYGDDHLKKWIELAPHLPQQDKSRKVFKSFASCSCDKKSHQQFCQHCQSCKVKFLFWTQCCRKWICQDCTVPRNDDELVKCFICQKKKKWIETVAGKNKFRYKKLLNPYAIIRNRRISQTHSINPLDVVQVEMGE